MDWVDREAGRLTGWAKEKIKSGGPWTLGDTVSTKSLFLNLMIQTCFEVPVAYVDLGFQSPPRRLNFFMVIGSQKFKYS